MPSTDSDQARVAEHLADEHLADFYALDALYTEAERRLRDTTREYVESEVLPYIGDWWQRETFPPHLPRALGELGLLGVTLPAHYGGQDASYSAYGLICQALEYGDSGLRSFLSVQSSLVMYPIYRYAADALKRRWLPPLAAGELIGCFALTEPHGGSDPAQMKVTARRVGDSYVLSGHKHWSTNGLIADLAVVWAKDELSGKVVGFVLETASEGFEARTIAGRASLRASVSSELLLHEVVVPAANKLEVEGLRGPLSCLNQARFGIAFGALGAGYACFDEVRRYTAARELFGEPLTHKQLVQAKLADMLADLTKGSLLAYHLGRLKAAGHDTPARVSLAKRDNVRAAQGVARAARDLLGGNGILTDYASIRHLLNLESVSSYEGTDAVHTLVLGREITGYSAF